MPQQCAEPPPRPPPTGAKQGHNPPTTPPPQPDSPGKPPKPHPPNPTHPRGSSPHTRGARSSGCTYCRIPRIIPAYAGSTGPGVFDPPRGWDHPRIRGEHRGGASGTDDIPGSSPHTRGARRLTDAMVEGFGIIPAYAGSTRPDGRRRAGTPDHPRIRGEHSRRTDRCPYPTGSSPHTRGAPSPIRSSRK